MDPRDRMAGDRPRRRCPLCQAPVGSRHEDGQACAPGYWTDTVAERLRVVEVMNRADPDPGAE